MNNSTFSQNSAIFLARIIGYCLLVLFLLDVLQILIPFNFFDSSWGYQVFGALVERSAVPLIGFVLLLLEGSRQRKSNEKIALVCLSWIALVIGISYFSIIPLGVGSAVRIYNQNQAQYISQLKQQDNQYKTLRAEVEQASPAQLNALVSQENEQKSDIGVENVSEVKQQLLQQLAASHKERKSETNSTKSKTVGMLFKNTIRWALGAMIVGSIFIYVWRNTKWARLRAKRQKTTVQILDDTSYLTYEE